MSKRSTKPVVLLIFANTGEPLPCLQEESDAIADALHESDLCEVEILPAAGAEA